MKNHLVISRNQAWKHTVMPVIVLCWDCLISFMSVIKQNRTRVTANLAIEKKNPTNKLPDDAGLK